MILLDTCALLALQEGGMTFSEFTRIEIEAPGSSVFISAISAFEIGQKYASGKLLLNQSPSVWFPAMLVQHQLTEIPVTAAIAVTAAELPKMHKDPFDRLIIATAMEQNLTILTSDKEIKQYPGVKTLW